MAKKKKNVSLFLLFIACLLLIIGGGWWWRWVNLPLDKNTTQTEIFVVKKGESIESIGQRLNQAYLIRNVAAFRISVLLKGVSQNIQAGSFSLGKKLSLSQLVEQLTHGTLDFWVTVPEGLRLEEVAARVAQQAQASKSVFDEAEFIRLSQHLEGQLFPDTYLISQGASVEQIVDMFRVNFAQKMSQINNSTDLTQKQLVILASLIEREAKHDTDRPIIAGILIKRLENDWPLQIDATIQYALGWQPGEQVWWKKNLTKTDIKIDSVFNTYQHLGMPPAPICNPGLKSLEAVANPRQTDFWFYLSDSKGITHFAKTIEEHNQNIERYLTK